MHHLQPHLKRQLGPGIVPPPSVAPAPVNPKTDPAVTTPIPNSTPVAASNPRTTPVPVGKLLISLSSHPRVFFRSFGEYRKSRDDLLGSLRDGLRLL